MHWIYLGIAILGEVVGTAALKASDGFTRLPFVGLTVIGYAVAFAFLGIVLRTIPIGIAYAIWSGAGVALVTLIGFAVFDQRLDAAGWLGIGLIVAGVVVLNLFSTAAPH